MIADHYRGGLRSLREQAPHLPLRVLLSRAVRWKLLRLLAWHGTVRVHGRSRMRLRAVAGDHGIRTGIFLLRDAYEPSVRFAIDRFVGEGDTCYDIGANQGLWSLRMAERVGQRGRVCAFEPVASNAVSLRMNAALSGAAIEILTIALSDSEGRAQFFVPADVGSGSLARHDAPADTMEVTLRRLDTVWEEQGRPRVAFVKLDVEGAEPAVLRGCSTFIETARPVVCCEINPERLRSMGAGPADIVDWFAARRYRGFKWAEAEGCLVPHVFDRASTATADLVFVPAEAAEREADATGRLR